MSNVILVACGSFNPPTKAHLWMYEVAKKHLTKVGYTVVRGYLSPVSDHYNKPSLLPAHHRVKMCKLAVQGNSDLTVNEWESNQPTYTNTINVLCHFAESNSESYKIMLLCGEDLLLSFLKPGVWRWEDVVSILRNHGVVCVKRGGQEVECHLEDPNSPLFPFRDCIQLVSPTNPLTICSTNVRERIQSGQSIGKLVHESVEEYIVRNKLY